MRLAGIIKQEIFVLNTITERLIMIEKLAERLSTEHGTSFRRGAKRPGVQLHGKIC
jgi:hypothetical protein